MSENEKLFFTAFKNFRSIYSKDHVGDLMLCSDAFLKYIGYAEQTDGMFTPELIRKMKMMTGPNAYALYMAWKVTNGPWDHD